MDTFFVYIQRRKWMVPLLPIIILLLFYYIPGYYISIHRFRGRLFHKVNRIVYYKYPLYNNSTEISMNLNPAQNLSSYYWFMLHKGIFKHMGAGEITQYRNDAAICHLRLSELGPISVNTSSVDLEIVEQQNQDVKLGGFYAPPLCRSRYRVAILIPYRDREKNLGILLRYIHPLLKKQLLEYRIFVIEQYGNDDFNKGTLYNIGYLESQRFGDWQCYIFQDVDLIPTHEKILYSCPRKPTHMSAYVEYNGHNLFYRRLFGGVTALTTEQFSAVNGYSNLYENWGAEDDDMFIRVQSRRYPLLRYNNSIAKYIALPHQRNQKGPYRGILFFFAKKRFRIEGLRSTLYKLVSVTKRKLYTHILADVDPLRTKPENSYELVQQIFKFINQSVITKKKKIIKQKPFAPPQQHS